jgi:superfamily I DNA/RNA helicase
MFVSPEDWKPTAGITLEGTALEVVTSPASISVLAGPGAGKTELLAQRAAFLMHTGICPPPKRILAIAFKVDAARNLQDRVAQRCDSETARRFESLTLHAFAKRTLDQFREALDLPLRPSSNYKIIFPNRDSWEEFQQAESEDNPGIHELNAVQFAGIVNAKLPDLNVEGPSVQERVRRRWWEVNLQRSPSTVTFDMVMLLATHIVRTQPVVKNAISRTYSHVFLDEFQDVTGQQYDLVRDIFQGSGAVITAVGDTKQAIMGWAGALPGIFTKFEHDFGAKNRKLLFNFRSNSAIVDLVNSLTSLLTEEETVRTQSGRQNALPPPDSIEGWIFPDRETEGKALADFVKDSLASDPTLRPHDFVVLARLRADDVETRMAPFFAANGLRLRNEARTLGPISIQDTLKEPVFLFLTALLKMAHGVRDGGPFQVSRDLIASIEGIDLATDRGAARSLRLVQELVSATIKVTEGRAPSGFDATQLTELAFPEVRKEQLGRIFKDYQNREYLESVIKAFSSFYIECSEGANSWASLIANLEGRDTVKLMTIHKSKGLEYHTVIFTEFNDDAFWNNADDVNVFFVALSRARERIRFSLTKDAKGFKNVTRFLQKLQVAGVQFREIG